jgi:fructose-1,6-bisphosphatase/inositol monophosphatase family enzyme
MIQMHMTKLLEQAISKARELPADQQDVLAAVMLSVAAGDSPVSELDDRSREAIRAGLAQARRGEFIPDEEIEALWKRYGA